MPHRAIPADLETRASIELVFCESFISAVQASVVGKRLLQIDRITLVQKLERRSARRYIVTFLRPLSARIFEGGKKKEKRTLGELNFSPR